MSDIQEKISQEIESAREVCSADGSDSQACAAAWDAVEELQAEASHQRQKAEEEKTSLDNYCADNPDAVECRIYED
ncbi:Calvin cycle protein CP12 [Lyngbya confervoides]|uniref:Calvin cycle protein CP12 n=1 Tax=Lyngbya confervoides BDU141951 TaxID=1574623 RepID=A0ABD4T651_9CYAN|nr:Calvin cycle protein CP12 [Lyngbya confervoides]MCM1984183.1 Calvin cycle protein CP12 [Lyngbya confervoides BDU141951]